MADGELITWEWTEGAESYEVRKNSLVISPNINATSYFDSAGVPADKYAVCPKVHDGTGLAIGRVLQILTQSTIDVDDFCRIEGTITRGDGVPVEGADIYISLSEFDELSSLDNASFINDVGVSSDYVHYKATLNGKFGFYLLRGQRYILSIPTMKYRVWFMVPAQTTLDVKDIVGTPVRPKEAF